jgi:hypothetical protein
MLVEVFSVILMQDLTVCRLEPTTRAHIHVCACGGNHGGSGPPLPPLQRLHRKLAVALFVATTAMQQVVWYGWLPASSLAKYGAWSVFELLKKLRGWRCLTLEHIVYLHTFIRGPCLQVLCPHAVAGCWGGRGQYYCYPVIPNPAWVVRTSFQPTGG